ncbi:transposase [Streptomyces sp. NRRL S-237]|uniref:transposase n=1 Tax=Streptomyces sp. NRRL S-237 TaxID=1463895 RepID=UPI000D134E29
MPGIGVRTGARTLIDRGDGSSFPAATPLAAYAGLAPATRSSGSTIRGERPSRRGRRAKRPRSRTGSTTCSRRSIRRWSGCSGPGCNTRQF